MNSNTFVVLNISADAFVEIDERLKKAGLDSPFVFENGILEGLLMNGIMLRWDEPESSEATTILRQRFMPLPPEPQQLEMPFVDPTMEKIAESFCIPVDMLAT